MGGVGSGGWLDTDNKTISVQLNLTGTATGTELGRIVFFTSFILKTIWESRMNKSKPSLYETRATLEAKCSILRKTRLYNQTPGLDAMMSNLT